MAMPHGVGRANYIKGRKAGLFRHVRNGDIWKIGMIIESQNNLFNC